MARKKDNTPEAAEITATPAAEARRTATVCMAAVRKTPDGPVIGTIPAGTLVDVIEIRDGFAKLSNGVFVSEDLLKK